MTQWRVATSLEEAADEISALFRNKDVADEVRRILRKLTEEDDPRAPHPESGLIVDEIEFNSPGWFRIKVPRYGIRIIFRLLIEKNQTKIEVRRLESIPSDAQGYFIDITQAGYRKNVYGEELRRRYRRLRGSQ